MNYFAQTLPQNALSQTPTTIDPQSGGTTANQELTPQNSSSTFALGSQNSSATVLNTSSQVGVQLSNTTTQTVTSELDTSTSQQSAPPFFVIGLSIIVVVVCMFVYRYAPKNQ